MADPNLIYTDAVKYSKKLRELEIPEMKNNENLTLTELRKNYPEFRKGEWVVEDKKDGIWALAVMDGRAGLKIYSRTGKLKNINIMSPDRALLYDSAFVCEAGWGTEWAVKMQESYGGHFMMVHDVIKLGGHDLQKKDASYRRGILDDLFSGTNNGLFPSDWTPVEQKPLSCFTKMWKEAEEGLVIKPAHGEYFDTEWFKVKKVRTYDYVIMDIRMTTAATKQSEPMIKDLILGLYINGKLTPVTKVGTMSREWCKEFAKNFKKYRGKVVEVKAYKQFGSGALRHASFIRVREDKPATECRLD